MFWDLQKTGKPKNLHNSIRNKIHSQMHLQFSACYFHHSILEYCEFMNWVSEYPNYDALSYL